MVALFKLPTDEEGDKVALLGEDDLCEYIRKINKEAEPTMHIYVDLPPPAPESPADPSASEVPSSFLRSECKKPV